MFDTTHGMKIHFGRKHKKIREVVVECDYCGCETTQSSKNNKRNDNNFCDNECYGQWRSELTGEDNPKYNRTPVLCTHCESEMLIQNNKLERDDNHFCNMNCYRSWLRRNINGERITYGNNWNKISSTIRDRDGECVECGISNKDCTDKYGCQLHVHHITPLKSFENLSKANEPENLISLCPSCHITVEYNGDT